jgi:hypothetical protein
MRPSLPLSVHCVGVRAGTLWPTTGLVDSGADMSCFPISLMEVLGVEETLCVAEACETAGGPATQYSWPDGIVVDFDGQTLHLIGMFIPGEMVLLGRRDFFAQYRAVSFFEGAKTFALTSA